MDYHIVEHRNAFHLAKIVKELIEQKWTPIGGIAYGGEGEGGANFAQAMVKYGTTPITGQEHAAKVFVVNR